MADAHKAARQHMQQESAQKFVGGDGHFARLFAVGVVFPKECDVAVGHGHETVVGNGHAVRIARQILEYMFWSAKWRLGVDDPILPEQLPEKRVKWFGLAQRFDPPMEAELLLAEEALQAGDKLATKNATKHADGKKEPIA